MSIIKIVTLKIDHRYYKNSNVCTFFIQGDTLTQKFMEKNRIIVRTINNTWNLYAEFESQSLWVPVEFEKNKINLNLLLSSNDENFYRSISDQNSNCGICCICNKENNHELQAISCTSANCANWTIHNTDVRKMQWRIFLTFDQTEFLNGEKNYTLHFDVKEVYWKYYLFTRFEPEALAIIDAESGITFLPGNRETFPYEKVAFTFFSDKKIPLTQKDTHNFRVVIKKGGTEKILVKRLPVASAKGIRYKDDRMQDFVSEIFITT